MANDYGRADGDGLESIARWKVKTDTVFVAAPIFLSIAYRRACWANGFWKELSSDSSSDS
jgi:hypothetical protein